MFMKKKKEDVKSADTRDAGVVEAKMSKEEKVVELTEEEKRRVEVLKGFLGELAEFDGAYSFSDFAQLAPAMKEVEQATVMLAVFVELRRIRKVLGSIEKQQFAG